MELGRIQKLEVARKVSFGIYLKDEAGEDVLLPAKQVPEGTQTGDILEVFLYKDSDDRLIATTAKPALTLHQTGILTVRSVTRIGAFLDWGLEKDLLLPFREQRGRVNEGDQVLAALYIDKSGRLAATMNVYPYLSCRAPYVVGDEVKGRVYETGGNFGIFVAVDDRFSALIPKHDAQGTYRPGEILDLRVTDVREDGRLVVTAKKKAYMQIGDDAARIMDVMLEEGGELPFDDKAAPEKINMMFGMSKAAFKRAVGHLMKERKVVKENGRLRFPDVS